MRLLGSFAVISLFGLISACGGSTSDGGGGGGSGSNVTVDRTKFVGVWAPSTARSVQVTCAGSNISVPLTQNFEWQLGDSSDLVGMMGGCSLKANVANNVATVIPNQTCNLTDPAPLALTFTSYTFTLGADGTTATDESQGTGKASFAGQNLDCTYHETGTYKKQAN